MRWRILTWCAVVSVVAVHTIDMELTTRYVGDDAGNEIFPPMNWAIEHFGINGATMLSRFIMYPLLYLALLFSSRRSVAILAFVVVTLYATSMLSWLWFLGIVPWPF